MRTLYLCDGMVDTCKKTGCTYLHEDGICRHTANEDHAINGSCDHPEEEPWRFFEVDDGVWYEMDDYQP